MKHSVKRVAAIHDLSGFGRASLTAIIPILSSMGVQVCPLPTAILSNHTGGFDTFSFVDFTDHMQDYIDHWKELNIDFDCIYSGFLGSERQIEIVSGFIDDFGTEDNMVVIDPVLGDNGNLYSTMDQGLVEGMKRLVTKADIITPNFTEVSLLLGEEYKQTTTDEEIKEAARRANMDDFIMQLPKQYDTYVGEKGTRLSGGQKQRVAIWKCNYRKPKAFLMDEPLSNLDAKLRAQMRVELVKLHKQLDTTIIYVTHDQTEAMTLGTKIVVMKDGLIQQVGAPQSIYDNPVNLFVAGFLGSPSMNFFRCTVKAEENNRTALLLDDAKTSEKGLIWTEPRGKQDRRQI